MGGSMQYILGLGQKKRVSINFSKVHVHQGFSKSVLSFGLFSIWNSSCGICHLVVNCFSRRAVCEAVYHFNISTVNNFSNTSRHLAQDHQLFPGPAVSPSAEIPVSWETLPSLFAGGVFSFWHLHSNQNASSLMALYSALWVAP